MLLPCFVSANQKRQVYYCASTRRLPSCLYCTAAIKGALFPMGLDTDVLHKGASLRYSECPRAKQKGKREQSRLLCISEAGATVLLLSEEAWRLSYAQSASASLFSGAQTASGISVACIAG